MDNGPRAQNSFGPCSECGGPLPTGTFRYCVHCGAEVGADHGTSVAEDDPRGNRTVRLDPPERPATPGRSAKPAPTTWSDGEYRAPSPLDDIPELPPPFSNDAWYSEAFLSNGHVVVPPSVPPTVPPAPIVLADGATGAANGSATGPATGVNGQVDGERPKAGEPTRAWAAPARPDPAALGVPPAPGTTQTAVQTDAATAGPAAPPTAAWSPDPGPEQEQENDPWARHTPRPEGWPPNADALPSEPAPQLPPGQFPGGQFPGGQFPGGQFPGGQNSPGQYPPGQYGPGQFPAGEYPPAPYPPGQPAQYQPNDQPWHITPGGVDPESSNRKGSLVAVVVGALALVVVTATGLWWLSSRDSDHVTAASSPGPAATSSVDPSAGASGDPNPTGSAAAAPTPDASGEPTPGASGAGGDAVTTLDGLLDRSTEARGQVGTTAVALQSCRVDAAQAAKVFRDAGGERKQLSSEASGLSASAQEIGDAVRSFIALQDASAQADESLAAWADEVTAQGCNGRAPRTANLDAANRFSAQASAAKARFVKLWNPIAAEHNLDSRNAEQI